MSGTLLLISDLEGCAKNGPPPAKAQQSQLLCSESFFNNLKTFLDRDPNNKVAFLGDYFDQGPFVVDSINMIMELKNEFEDRVIIILGNRDINKLRLTYEMKENFNTSVSDAKWPVWNAFYGEIVKCFLPENKLKEILSKSMGAAYPPNLDEGLTPIQASYLLVKVFLPNVDEIFPRVTLPADEKYNKFVKNCKQLFSKGKIVHYDEQFATLLSHAGGMDTFFFHTPAYYDTIKASFVGEKSYYSSIEKARLALQLLPADRALSFDENTYNGILQTVCSEVFGGSLPEKPSEDFIVLQALGLKPNPGLNFVSFIQSCDIQGCKGPLNEDLGAPYDSAGYKRYLNQLNTSGINVIASGHVPHCAPIPLIYKRSEGPGLFIGNDTSNGYRPAAIDTIDKIPLSYVINNGNSAGVGSLKVDGNISNDTTFKGTDNLFASMVNEWTYESAPLFVDKEISYNDGNKLTFPARSETKIPQIFAAAVMKKAEGGRRRRKTHKKRRSTKKQSKSRRRQRRQ